MPEHKNRETIDTLTDFRVFHLFGSLIRDLIAEQHGKFRVVCAFRGCHVSLQNKPIERDDGIRERIVVCMRTAVHFKSAFELHVKVLPIVHRGGRTLNIDFAVGKGERFRRVRRVHIFTRDNLVVTLVLR